MNLKNRIILALVIGISISCSDSIGLNKSDSKNKNTNAMIAAVIVANNQNKPLGNTTEIKFSAVAGTQPTELNCSDTFKGHASIQDPLFHISESVNIHLVDLKFYIHEVKLIKADGSKVDFSLTADNIWQTSRVALLDFEDGTGTCVGGTKEKNTSIRGSVASGSYTGIEFKLGVPFDLNHLMNTSQAAPLNNSTMYWSWQSGYKFMKFEFNATDGAGTTNQLHLASNGCPSSNATGANAACTYPNRPTISVTKASGILSLSTDSIALDIKNLLNGTNSNITSGGSQILCHGSANTTTACQTVLTNIGLVPSTGLSSGTQTAFYVK